MAWSMGQPVLNIIFDHFDLLLSFAISWYLRASTSGRSGLSIFLAQLEGKWDQVWPWTRLDQLAN